MHSGNSIEHTYSADSGSHYKLYIDRLLTNLDYDSQISLQLQLLNEASDGDFYIFGGTLRRTLIGSNPGGDIDIMVANDDNRIFDYLDKQGVAYTLNRRRHHRYLWNSYQFDINQPKEWQDNFKSIIDVLSFSDLLINSLAFHFGTHTILDPFKMIEAQPCNDPKINWNLWNSLPPLELAIKTIRLYRILEDCPRLSISEHDSNLLLKQVLPMCININWASLQDRIPNDVKDFPVDFRRVILARSIATNK